MTAIVFFLCVLRVLCAKQLGMIVKEAKTAEILSIRKPVRSPKQ
jgi:hypothetical protein